MKLLSFHGPGTDNRSSTLHPVGEVASINSMAKLPVELLNEVVAYLDRPSLLVFVRVSPEFWELGIPILYRRLTVNGRGLRRMFLRAGGRPLRRNEVFVSHPPASDGELEEL